MDINTQSWHCKAVDWLVGGGRPQSLCLYFWATLAAVVILAFRYTVGSFFIFIWPVLKWVILALVATLPLWFWALLVLAEPEENPAPWWLIWFLTAVITTLWYFIWHSVYHCRPLGGSEDPGPGPWLRSKAPGLRHVFGNYKYGDDNRGATFSDIVWGYLSAIKQRVCPLLTYKSKE